MNPVDRFQATIRHPDYRNDPRLSLREKNEFGRFDLPSLFSEGGPLSRFNKEWCLRYAEYCHFLRIWGLRHAVYPGNSEEVAATLNDLRTGDASIFTDDLRGYDGSEDRYTPNSDHGHFLTINVDLERPTGELLELIGRMIDSKRRESRIKTKRTKSHGADPWDVWDKMQVPRNNLLKITHSLFKVNGNPTYDEKTKRVYDRVKRAYSKAISMIEEVGMSRNKVPSREVMEASLALFIPRMKEIIRSIAASRSPRS